jgi:membrane-bound lytic murein transglycosylase B
MRKLKGIFILLILVLFSCNTLLAAQPTPALAKQPTKSSKKDPASRKFGDRREVQQFIWDMYVKHKLNVQENKKLFRTIGTDPKVIQAMSKPFEEVPWAKYRERFVTDERAQAGVEFWNANEDALKKAEAEFGVPPEIIIAIIGVETYYGRNMGNFLVLQALSTLAFDYPPRAQFFRKELEQFLLLAKEEALDVSSVFGSYAGAMGIPQFIPSSYRRYAVDFTGSGRRDLINNTPDAIGSVASYFRENGWEPNQPVAYVAQVFGSEYQRLANTNQKAPLPKLTLGDYAKFNIQPKDSKILKNVKSHKASFIILNDKTFNPEHWLTLQNFYVITRYNHSVNYAMAVYQLSQRIQALHR